MEGGENIAPVFVWKLIASIKTNVQCRRVRLHEYIADNNVIGKIDMSSFVFGIGMIPDVEPWPTIEPARAHAADIIRRQIRTELVTLVRAHPHLIGSRPKHDSDRVANSPSVHLLATAIGIELQDSRPVGFRF